MLELGCYPRAASPKETKKKWAFALHTQERDYVFRFPDREAAQKMIVAVEAETRKQIERNAKGGTIEAEFDAITHQKVGPVYSSLCVVLFLFDLVVSCHHFSVSCLLLSLFVAYCPIPSSLFVTYNSLSISSPSSLGRKTSWTAKLLMGMSGRSIWFVVFC
jgi:hypothetical protein